MNPPEVSNRETNSEMKPVGTPSTAGSDDGGGGGPRPIKIKVSYGPSLRELSIVPESTFGDLKKVLSNKIGLDPVDQRLFFRGREKDDSETLHKAGIKDLSKLLLMERPESKERKIEEAKQKEEISKACLAIAEVRAEVDKLSEKVAKVDTSVSNGVKLDEKEFIVLTELLMRQLLKLDGIVAGGEAKAQRKNEVKRIQSFVDKLDALKATNANPFVDGSNAVTVYKSDSGAGSLSPSSVTSTRITQEWERFD